MFGSVGRNPVHCFPSVEFLVGHRYENDGESAQRLDCCGAEYLPACPGLRRRRVLLHFSSLGSLHSGGAHPRVGKEKKTKYALVGLPRLPTDDADLRGERDAW